MRNVLQMQSMRKELECEPICEDSKARIYLSLVPSKAIRIQRYKDTSRAVTEALKHFFGPVSTVAIQVLFSIGIAMLTYELIQIRMAPMRGYVPSVGGEIFIAPAVGLVAYKALSFVFRSWRNFY